MMVLMEGYARLKKSAVLVFAALPALIVTVAWTIHRWQRLGASWPYFVGAVGNLVGLVGLSLLVIVVVLGTRLRLVERLWGLDRMMRAHKALAKVAAAVILAHALLKTLKISMVGNEGWQWAYLADMQDWWPLVVGRIALLGLLVLAGLAIAGGKRIPFRVWKSGHLLLYPVVAAGCVHARFAGDDMTEFPYNAVGYVLACTLGALLLYRVAYYLTRRARCTWRVDQVIPETHDTNTLSLTRDKSPGAFARRRAGQFCLIRIERRLGWSEPHPFTISCSPSAERLCLTIKRAGRFTASIPKLKQGTPVLCEGPYGVLCPELRVEKNIVMIAGGVGITPFLSAIRHAADTRSDSRITLIWGNKTRKDIIAAEELLELAKTRPLRVVHVLSQEKEADQCETTPGDGTGAVSGVRFETGLVTAVLLKKTIDPDGATYYLCGPPPMMRSVLGQLRETFGVRPRHVKRERFAW